jgi:hypothetical protein
MRRRVAAAAMLLALSGCVGGATRPLAPGGPIDLALDAKAKAGLQQAVRVALVHFAEMGEWQSFDAAAASARSDAAVRWADAVEPSAGVVSILFHTATEVHLVTRSESDAFFCAHAAGDGPVVTFGSGATLGEVDSAPECPSPSLEP